jgi:hypothetical protein
MDLVQLALLPGTPAELRRIAEDQLVGRLPQLPLGQKIALARRGRPRGGGAARGRRPANPFRRPR